LRRYGAGEYVPLIAGPLDLSGHSVFEQRVWAACRRIPYGEIRTYERLAAQVSPHRPVQAVGRVLAKTPVPIIIPCHRVVSSDGSLGNYVGDLALKRRLLALEWAAVRR
jgi:O-6-methylguanine DNA methyltransferase